MMTEKLFYSDAYITAFEGTVLSCEEVHKGFLVSLERTAFYPEGGGQAADTGTLGGAIVFDVHEQDGIVYHHTDRPLVLNEKVSGTIDWERRFDFMQNHTGEHILSGVICEKYGCDNVGFHMGRDVVTIDFNIKIPAVDFVVLEERANTAIWRNTEIEISYPSEKELEKLLYRSKIALAGEVRITAIAGYDCCACCGTHVRGAGEVGMIKIISGQNYKGGTRLEILCGGRALRHYQGIHEAAAGVGSMLSVTAERIALPVEMLVQEKNRLLQEVGALRRERLQAKVDALEDGIRNVCYFEIDMNGKDMIHFADSVLEKVGERVVVCNQTEAGFAYVLLTKLDDGDAWRSELAEEFQAKGGGKKNAIQGRLQGGKNEIKDFFEGRGFMIRE